MAILKLPRLPDRTPVKLTVNVSPDLKRALDAYAEVYEAVYGEKESVADLVPFMLAGFLEGDREFARVRKARDGRG